MKRFLSCIAAAVLCIAASAQTNFRNITYKEAIEAAKAEKKQVFMDFYTDWCGPCKMMTREVFPQKMVGDYMNKRFVCIKINAEKGDGVALADKYKIKAYPTFIVIDTTEKEIGRKMGSNSPEGFISNIEQMVNPNLAPEVIKKRYESGERTAEVVKNYAANELDALIGTRITQEDYDKKRNEMRQLVQDYFTKLSDKDRVKPENMFIYREYTNNIYTPSGRFLCSSVNKFKGEEKVEADSLMRSYYKREVLRLLGGNEPVDEAKYKALKDEIHSHGLDTDPDYTTAYSFIESAGSGDNDAYMKLCDKSFDKLGTDIMRTILTGYAKHFKNADAATRKEAALLLRRHLPVMNNKVLYYAVNQIAVLENGEN